MQIAESGRGLLVGVCRPRRQVEGRCTIKVRLCTGARQRPRPEVFLTRASAAFASR